MKSLSTLNRWVICPKPNPQAKLRLFCFHYAGGGASVFRTWSDSLPESVEVCAIELPGRGIRIRESLFTQIEPLVQHLACTLLPRACHQLGKLESAMLRMNQRRNR